ncbi:MAG: SGNH/GDSL hydrolase family protein [Adhaeribacter sp.]
MKRLLFILILILPLGSFSSRPLTWVALGDSITYLNDHPDETGNRVQKGYLSRVKEEIPGLEYINKGYNGWTAQGIARNIEHLSLVKADVYSIFLGTNDWWSGRPVGTLADYTQNTGPDTYYGSYRVIIDKIRRLNPDAPILLITPMQRGDFVYLDNRKNNAYGSYQDKNGQSLAAFADAVIAIGKQENLPVVNLYYKSGMSLKKMVKYKRLKDPATGAYRNYPYPQFIGIPFNPATDAYPYPAEAAHMTYDGLHPSDKGNAVIARMVAKTMKKEFH